jgi:hypothetical protein
LGAFFQPSGTTLRHLDLTADLGAQRYPALRRNEVRFRIGIAAAGCQPDIACPESAPEFPEDTQFIVVTMDTTVLVHDIRLPLRRDEIERGIRRQRSTLVGIRPP